MKTVLCTLLAFLMLPSAARAADTEAFWADYKADGWTEIGRAAGDLNKDGIEDLAIAIEAPEAITEPANSCTQEDDYSDAPVRRLIVALGDGSGGYELSADEPRAILRADEGGIMGDPFQGIAIAHGSIVIEHYGGSRWRWGQTTRFRLEEGGWLMTGMTELQHDSIYNSVIEYDYNALTYKIAVTVDEGVDDPEAEPVCVACRAGEACGSGDCYKTTKPAKTGTTWFDTPRRDRVTLSGFRCWFEQTGLLEHTGFQVRR
jgi:hypothetical protein